MKDLGVTMGHQLKILQALGTIVGEMISLRFLHALGVDSGSPGEPGGHSSDHLIRSTRRKPLEFFWRSRRLLIDPGHANAYAVAARISDPEFSPAAPASRGPILDYSHAYSSLSPKPAVRSD